MSEVGEGGEIRESRPGEEERLAFAARRAFQEGTPDGWHAYFRDNSHLETTLVCERRGAIAGQASLLAFSMKLAGADVPVKGYAAVAVAPVERRAGVADALMKASLEKLREERTGLALLYPFRAPFYRRFGFGRCEWMEELVAVPRELPGSPLRRHVRALELQGGLPEADRRILERIYARATSEATGPLARSPYWWNVRVLARCAEGVLYEDAQGPSGYLLYDVPKAPKANAAFLVVKELAAATPEAFRGLLGFLAALRDQFAKVSLVLPRGSAAPLMTGLGPERVLCHFGFYRKLGHFLSGAMARLVHLETALALHPGPARFGGADRVGLDLADPLFPDQSGAFDLVLEGGARLARGSRERERLELPIDLLAAIFTGASSARALHAAGLVSGSARAAAHLDAAFAGPPPFLWPLNGF